MGTSFTKFRGFGFWASDGQVAAWMANLVREIDLLPKPTKEQRAFRDDLILQASLEHVHQSENLKTRSVEIGHRAFQEYVRWGQYIDGNWLESLMKAEGAVDTGRHFVAGPTSSELHLLYRKNWLRMLEGNFDPLPLHPSGYFNATGEI